MKSGMASSCWHCSVALLLAVLPAIQAASLYRITPDQGSIAGGTRVTLEGDGFSTDQYGTADLVFFGNVPCDVDWFTVRSYRIECTTRPHPTAKRGDTVPIEPTLIVSGSIRFSTANTGRQRDREFQYRWDSTPRTSFIYPLASPATSILSLGGPFFSRSNTLEWILVGPYPCVLKGLTESDLHTHCSLNAPVGGSGLCCRLGPGVLPGSYNISVAFSNYGRSYDASDGLKVSRRGSLRMYEHFPTLASIFPREGSWEGGTLLSIEGGSFGNDVSNVSVLVGEVPCRVVAVVDSAIKCITGRPTDSSPVLVARQNLTGGGNVSRLPLFPGNRGASIKQFMWGVRLVDDLYTDPRFPHEASQWEHSETFGTQRTRTGVQYVTSSESDLVEAYFVPPFTATYTFYLSNGGSTGDLWFSMSEDPNEATLIAYVTFEQRHRLNQRSSRMQLEAGKRYFMRGVHSTWDSSRAFLQVGVLIHDTNFTYENTHQAQREVQSLRITATNQNERQQIVVTTDLSAVGETDSFRLAIGSRPSGVLPLHDLSAKTVHSALSQFLVAECQEMSGEAYASALFDFFDFDSFERSVSAGGVVKYADKFGSVDSWLRMGSLDPVLQSGSAFCGNSFLRIRNGGAVNFRTSNHVEGYYEQSAGWYPAEFSKVCTAYRIPPGVGAFLRLNLETHGWYSVPMTTSGHTEPSGSLLPQWLDATERPLVADNQWHFACYDVNSALQRTALGTTDGIMVLEQGFLVYPTVADQLLSRTDSAILDIDEFSISSVKRGVAQLYPALNVGDQSISDFSVAVSSTGNNQTNTTTITIDYNLEQCNRQTYDLLRVDRGTLPPTTAQFNVSRLRAASLVVHGHVSLQLFNGQTLTVKHDTTALELTNLLQALPGVGKASVGHSNRDTKGCSGATWTITYDSQPGDLQPMRVIANNLTGTNVAATTTEDIDGGLLLAPIPGDMLQGVEEDPQVVVTVNDIPAACAMRTYSYPSRLTSGTPCAFTYSSALTPSVTTVSPQTGMAGTLLTITGTGFDEFGENEVTVGGVACVLTSYTTTQLQCLVPALSAGSHAVSVRVPAKGYSSSCVGCSTPALLFNSSLVLSSVSPPVGSIAGGTVLTLVGNGFSLTGDTSGVSVQVDGVACTVTFANLTLAKCTTQTSPTERLSVNVIVSVTDAHATRSATLAAAYGYANASTPKLTAISLGRGSGGGGTTVTLTGNFLTSAIGDISHVKVGSASCEVLGITGTGAGQMLTCRTSPHAPGSVTVTYLGADGGVAVGEPNFVYELEVADISHVFGSRFGGQLIEITGTGFPTSASQLQVKMGVAGNCEVVRTTATSIHCTTPSPAVTHQLTNNAINAKYGWGYAWDKANLTIQQGDSVRWSWTGSPFASLRGVAQVVDEISVMYDGSGFRSNRSTEGDFTNTFTSVGTFHYISEGFGHIGFRGYVRVVPFSSVHAKLEVILNGIKADVSAPALASATQLRQASWVAGRCSTEMSLPSLPMTNSLYYTFSTCHTPYITSLQNGSNVHVEQRVQINGMNLPLTDDFSPVLMTINGAVCGNTSTSSDRTTPRSMLSMFNESLLSDGAKLYCSVPHLPGGFYRLQLHIEGLGWALANSDADQLQVAPIVYADEDAAQGSILGGTTLMVTGSGFGRLSSADNQVFIGNTPCDVTYMSMSSPGSPVASLTCITRQMVDDGYSAVVDLSRPLAYWRFTLKAHSSSIANLGSLGSALNAPVHTWSWTSRPGLPVSRSSPSPNMAAFFDERHPFAPYHSKLYSNVSFGVALWLKLDNEIDGYRQYRQVIGSYESGELSRGFSLWITPCGQLELWIAPGISQVNQTADKTSLLCPEIELLNSESDSNLTDIQAECSVLSMPCAGKRLITRDPLISAAGGDINQLPTGAWSVINQPARNLSRWTYVAFGYEKPGQPGSSPSCPGPSNCKGSIFFSVDGSQPTAVASNYLPPLASRLEFGGSSRVQKTDFLLPLNRTTLPFTGQLAELSMYDRPLGIADIREQLYYGQAEEQKIFVHVDGQDRRGEGATPEVIFPKPVAASRDIPVDWDNGVVGRVSINDTDRLIFSWTGLGDVHQVSRDAYTACDLKTAAIKQWHPLRSGGRAIVSGLENGRTYYFVSTAYGSCTRGVKCEVTVGNQHAVAWTIGVQYADLVVTQGGGVLFNWDTSQLSTHHNVVEVKTRQAFDQCDTSSSAGGVLKYWSHPGKTQSASSRGQVEVTGLAEGWHYFLCSVPGHCNNGMRIAVKVIPEVQTSAGGSSTSPAGTQRTVQLQWRIQPYSTVHIEEGQTIRFQWDAFHSLHEVDKTAYDSCDIVRPPLVEWASASVSSSLTISNLTAGNHFFICSVSGHCGAGMKVMVEVRRKSLLPALSLPITAMCSSVADAQRGTPPRCKFMYAKSSTPVLESLSPGVGPPGTLLNITGRWLEQPDRPVGSAVTHIHITVGTALCSNPRLVANDSDGMEGQIVECQLGPAEAGSQAVRVVNMLGTAQYRPASPTSPTTLWFVVTLRLSALSPSRGSLGGGTAVVLSGLGFTHAIADMTVTFNGRPAPIVLANQSHITVTTPSAASVTFPFTTSQAGVELTVNGRTANLPFSYDATLTFLLSDMSAGLLATDPLTIHGQFGSWSAAETEVTVKPKSPASSVCVVPKTSLSIQHLNSTALVASLPNLEAGQYEVMASLRQHGDGVWRDASRNTLTVPLRINSISPTSVGHGGGEVLTITGSGFPSKCSGTARQSSVAFQVRVCSSECIVTEQNHNQIKCTLPPSPTALRATSRDFTADDSCSIGVQVALSQVNGSQSIMYAAAKTSVVKSVLPHRGGTAGGTELSISATLVSMVNATVSIDGANCVITFINTTLVKCRTSDHRTTLVADVRIHTPGNGLSVGEIQTTVASSTSVQGSAYFQYVDRWSSRYTWGGNKPPAVGESVSIRRGQTLLLDVITPELKLVVVQGDLIFDDSQNVLLQAKYIFIHGGSIRVGSQANPFQHRATIRLLGNIRDPEIPVYGAKVLALRQGHLELYGKPRLRTWTRLSRTARQNETSLHLQEPVDWVNGDTIVLAPTGKNTNETEELTVNYTSTDGLTVYLAQPLNYTHHGETEDFGNGNTIEIRAEVGLLTHNVVVEGSVIQGANNREFGNDQYGSHIMIHRVGTNTTQVRLEHVEVRHAGQAFRLGRYAIHFHLSGNLSNSWVRHCSIHHSFNRAITAHGVHGMLFERNVAYDIKGHTFFIEDGIETENRYLYNLGLVTKGSSSLLNTDQIPATFWITHPNNIFIGNAAAGSRAYGFWYDLDAHSVGPSRSLSVCPNTAKMGTFRDNVAHSNAEFGLRVWEKYTPKVKECDVNGADAEANFYGLTTYANGIHGVEMSVIGRVKMIGFKIADSRDNGIEITESVGSGWDAAVENTLIISYTPANTGAPGKGGIKLPKFTRMSFTNITFVNFDSPSQVCLKACSHCKDLQGGYKYRFSGLKFPGKSVLHKASFQWTFEVLLKDLDGSLTGQVGGWMLPLNGYLPPEHCNMTVPAASFGGVKGAICTPAVRFLRFAFNQVEPLGTFAGRALILNTSYTTPNITADKFLNWRHYRITHMDGYMATLPSKGRYFIDWNAFGQPTDVTSYNAGLEHLEPEDYLVFEHQVLSAPDHFNVGSNEVDLGREPTPTDLHKSWHFDNTTNRLTYLLSGGGGYKFAAEPCPLSGCPVPAGDAEPPEGFFRYWSNPLHWATGRLPTARENVTILSRWKMIMDVSPPELDRLNVLGHLEFGLVDINLTASTIFVYGKNAKFIVGNSTSHRYKNKARITLMGHINVPAFALSRTMIIGAKALAVFGELTMLGKERNVVWTRLAHDARQNDTSISLTGTRVDWQPGEQIVIAASGYNAREYDLATIHNVTTSSSSPGGLVYLTAPLQHDHLIQSFLNGSETQAGHKATGQWWRNTKLAPEVGLLSRNIQIRGGEDSRESIARHGFGCRVIVGAVQRGFKVYSGKATMDGVEVTNCGQAGFSQKRDPRYSMVFKGVPDSKGSTVQRSSFHHNFNVGVGIHLTKGVTLSDNIVFSTTGSSFIVGGSNNKVLSNLAIMMRSLKGEAVSDSHVIDYPAAFEVGGVDNVVRGNAAGGSERLSFSFPGTPCNSDNTAPTGTAAKFWDNTAHSSLIGLKVVGLPGLCASIGGFTATHHWDFAMFSWTASSLVATHVAIGVGRVGFTANIFGPSSTRHQYQDKFVRLENSLLVGQLPGEVPCTPGQLPPYHIQTTSFPMESPKAGIMMSTFSITRGKLDGTGPWGKPKSYPAVRGVMHGTDIAFARFYPTSTHCGIKEFGIVNNPLSPDAMHPLHLRRSVRMGVHRDSLAFLNPPNPAWINQEDCVDMDCDGPKHSIIVDLDGTFTGNPLGRRGSIVPRAEIHFNASRIPTTPRSDGTNGPLLPPPNRGTARGFTGNISALGGGCEWRAAWNSYECSGLKHAMLVIESMDPDTETRRLSPLAVRGGDIGHGKYIDLMNGPMDHGWCTYYTCLKRLSTFFAVVVLDTDYELWLTGSNPSHWRFHLLNAQDTDSIRLKIWYKNVQRKDVYKNGIFIEPENVHAKEDVIDDKHIPDIATAIGGANYFDIRKLFLHLVLRGTDAIDVITAPVVRVSFNLQVSLDDFFDPQHLVFNLAFALGIPLESVRLVDVISEATPLPSGRRRRAVAMTRKVVTVEIGDAPSNRTTTAPPPPISQQIASGNVDAEKNDVDLDANSTSDGQPTGNVTAPSPYLQGSNLTDAPTPADIKSALLDSSSQYLQQVDQYTQFINSTNRVNQLGVALVNLLVTGRIKFPNATLTNASLSLSAPPPVPQVPVLLPPSLTDLSFPGLPNISSFLPTPVDLPTVDFPDAADAPGGAASPFSGGLSLSIPTRLNVIRHPVPKSGHLVFIEVEVLDNNDQRSTSIGVIGDQWVVTAQIAGRNTGSQLTGNVTAVVKNGVAQFTRLRVDREIEGIRIVLSVSPGTLPSVQTSMFSVAGPGASVERKHITLALSGTYSQVVQGKESAFQDAVVASLALQLDVDPSRFERVEVQQVPFQVSFNLVEKSNASAPDVPSLNQATVRMAALVGSNSLLLYFEGRSVSVTSTTVGSLPPPSSTGNTRTTIIIAASCGGGTAALLMIMLIIVLKTKKKNKGRSKKTVDRKDSQQSRGLSSTDLQMRRTKLQRPADAAMVSPTENEYASGHHTDVYFRKPPASSNTPLGGMFQVEIGKSYSSVASIGDVSMHVRSDTPRPHPLLPQSSSSTNLVQKSTSETRRLGDMAYPQHGKPSRTTLPGEIDY